jgi:hypothetical protein
MLAPIHVKLSRINAGTKMKYFALVMFLVFSIFYASGKEKYNLESTYSDATERLLYKYTNLSSEAHCVRASDFSPDFFSDGFYVKVKGGKAAYIGETEQYVDFEPRNFIILPPSSTYQFSVKIRKYYDIGNGSASVKYAVSVSPCSLILKRYIDVPPVDFLKLRQIDTSLLDMKFFSKDYPEWYRHGFIAVSNETFIP